MKIIWEIFKSDIKKISKSWVTMVIILGITLLPPLYAWINIYGSWDPYSNTKGLKVAVVNKDIGSTINNLDFNIGNELETTLKTNDKMGWKFVDDEYDSIEMVRKGDVYASIIIPEDFSSRMATFGSKNPVKPTLEYYVNEKENAIAPKMTDSAANMLTKQITESITSTAVEKVFDVLNGLGYDMQGNYPDIQKYISALRFLNNNYPLLDEKLDNLSKEAKDGLVKIDQQSEDFIYISDIMEKTIDFNNNFSSSLLDLDAKIKEYSPDIKENFVTAESLFSNISRSAGYLGNDIETGKPMLISDIDNAVKDLDTISSDILKVSNNIIDFSQTSKDDAKSITSNALENVSDLKVTLNDLKDTTKDFKYVENLLYDLSVQNDELSDKIIALEKVTDEIFNPVEDTLEKLENILNDIEGVVNGNTDQNFINTLKGKISDINNTLRQNTKLYGNVLAVNYAIIDNLDSISNNNLDAASDIKSNNMNLSSCINSIRTKVEAKHDNINYSLDKIYNLTTDVSKVCNVLSDDSSLARRDITRSVNSTLVVLDDVERVLQKNNDKLSTDNNSIILNNATKTGNILLKIDELKSKLNDAKSKLSDRNSAENILYDTQKLTYDIQSQLDTITSNLDNNILPKIESYLNNGSNYIDDINVILGNMSESVNTMQSFLDDVSHAGEVSIDKLNDLKSNLPNISKGLGNITGKIDKIDKLGFGDIIDFLVSNGAKEGDILSSPINLSSHSVYHMVNYGMGLTPFYTTLSLWVGALFLVALLTTKAKNIKMVITPTQEFYGKYALFANLAIVQGLIASLGDLLILKVHAENPILFVLLAMFYSLLFSMIVYSLVTTLNNIGKAIAVLFMLLQIMGSGGTFPIQVTPMFFQVIYKLLPFTYAISGLREALFGVVFNTLVKDIGVLLLYFATFTVLGSVLKNPLNKFISGFSNDLHHSGIFE